MDLRAKVLACSLLITCAAPAAHACPPYPFVSDLWSAVELADAVVVADVVSIRPTARAVVLGRLREALISGSDAVAGIWFDGGLLLQSAIDELGEPPSEVRLIAEVRENVAGHPIDDLRVEVVLAPWGLPRSGERVLLFLADENGRWRLPRGPQSILPISLVPRDGAGSDDAAVADLGVAILAAHELLQSGDVDEEAVASWLVLATALRASRPFAVERLLRAHPTPDQLRVLTRVFLSEPVQLPELRRWLRVLKGTHEPEIYRHAARAIERERHQNSARWHWFAQDLLVHVGLWKRGPSDGSPTATAEFEQHWLRTVAARWSDGMRAEARSGTRTTPAGPSHGGLAIQIDGGIAVESLRVRSQGMDLESPKPIFGVTHLGAHTWWRLSERWPTARLCAASGSTAPPYRANQAGKRLEKHEYVTELEFSLAPLPCWAQLEPEEVKRRVRALVDTIEQGARERHRATGSNPMGEKRIRAQHPHDQPLTSKRSKAPLCHTATLEEWICYKQAYREFVEQIRHAAERLKRGVAAKFPPGSFPPRRPWVPFPVDATS